MTVVTSQKNYFKNTSFENKDTFGLDEQPSLCCFSKAHKPDMNFDKVLFLFSAARPRALAWQFSMLVQITGDTL